MKLEIIYDKKDRFLKDRIALNDFKILPKNEFLKVWRTVFWLYPGLHPDEASNPDGGWPEELTPFATEALQRYEKGMLSDREYYCYKASKQRIMLERAQCSKPN